MSRPSTPVVGYGEVLRQELAAEGINVSLLFPGGMITRHLESSVAARPAELGESRLEREDIEAMMASADMTVENHLATAEHAVRNLLEELRTRDSPTSSRTALTRHRSKHNSVRSLMPSTACWPIRDGETTRGQPHGT